MAWDHREELVFKIYWLLCRIFFIFKSIISPIYNLLQNSQTSNHKKIVVLIIQCYLRALRFSFLKILNESSLFAQKKT